MSRKLEISRSVCPEDLAPGQFVTLSRVTYELISEGDLDASFGRDLTPRRIRLMPCSAGEPLKVIRVSLPFVLARSAKGTHITLDLRRVELMQLGAHFGRESYDRLRKDRRSGDGSAKSKRRSR